MTTPERRGGKTREGITQTQISVKLNNVLLARLAKYPNRNRLINDAVQQRLDQLEQDGERAARTDAN